MTIPDDFPLTVYDEDGDIECQTCEKKFFAPGLCDTCFAKIINERQQEEIAGLKAQLEACQAQQQAAVEAARVTEFEQCCKDVCFSCWAGILKVIIFVNGNYVHANNDDHPVCSCTANAIRQRWAKEQAEDKQ